MKERDRELERVSAQLVQARDAVKAFETKCRSLEQSHSVAIHDFSSRIRGLESDAAKLGPLTEELDERRQEVREWERRYEELEAHGRAEKLRLERRVAELEPLIEEGRLLRERVMNLDGEVRSRQQALEELTREREGQDERLNVLRLEHAQLTAKLTGVEDALRATELAQHTLAEQSTSEIAGLTTRIQDLNGEIGDLTGRLDQRSEQVADLERRLEERSAEIGRLNERYEARSQEIAGLQDSYQEAVRQRDALEAELASKQAEVRALDAEIADLRLQLNSTIHSVDGQKTRISELMGTLETSQSEIERAKAKIAERDNYFRSAQQVLNEMRPMLEALEQQLKSKNE
jgi:chromosome segregation ATPase